jgi:ribosomal protein L18E
MKTRTKTFDCVAMKHEAQERIRRELANLSREEELAYWRRIAERAEARRRKRLDRGGSGTASEPHV